MHPTSDNSDSHKNDTTVINMQIMVRFEILSIQHFWYRQQNGAHCNSTDTLSKGQY